jgi:hypothetical protein
MREDVKKKHLFTLCEIPEWRHASWPLFLERTLVFALRIAVECSGDG